MPTNQYNTTFNRGNNNSVSYGFYSRTLFTWTNLSDGYNLSSQSEWISNDNGNGLQLLIDNKPEYCHGDITLPPNYWTSGKTIRFRGTFGANSDDENQIFNMRFGLQETSGPITQWFAIQNNDNNHIFALSTNTGGAFLPINFQCLMMCCTRDHDGDPWFTANGFYKYNQVASNSSDNRNSIEVPVWDIGAGGSPNGVASAAGSSFISNQTKFTMNCYGSTVSSIQLLNLTIEELL
jgi:hypothetical protein